MAPAWLGFSWKWWGSLPGGRIRSGVPVSPMTCATSDWTGEMSVTTFTSARAGVAATLASSSGMV